MIKPDVGNAVNLISHAMNKHEAMWAGQAFDFYFDCKEKDIDPARDYYVARYNEHLCGLVGLHHYRWGPPANVWLSWFAVHPEYQRQGLGAKLVGYIQEVAITSGYRQMLIETYNSDEFALARKFYQRHGFSQTGQIEHYINQDTAMLVYSKQL